MGVSILLQELEQMLSVLLENMMLFVGWSDVALICIPYGLLQ